MSATVPPDGVVRLMLAPGPHTFTLTLICDGRIFTARQDADVVSGQALNLTMRVTVSDVCAAQQPQRRRRGEQSGRGLAFLEPLWPDALRRVASLAGWPGTGPSALAVGPGGGVMLAQVPNPVPSIASITPNFAAPGSGPLGMVVYSNDFDYITTSVVQWTVGPTTTNLTTAFQNATQVNATIPAALLVSAGTATVTVFNPGPGGGSSNGVTFTITSTNPVAVLYSLTPTFALPGGPGFGMVVTGNNFVSGSVVQWNGATRPTSFSNVTQITAGIPASDIATPGTASVTVFNPPPGGGTSNALTFTITSTSPVPEIFSLTPPSATAGGDAFAMTVTGQNFFPGAVVQWNGSSRPTAFENSTQVRAAISAGDIANAGTAQVSVLNPPPGGGSSNALPFTICARGL